MANKTNDSLYSTTNSGAALGTSNGSLPNIPGPITLTTTVDQQYAARYVDVNSNIGFYRDGIALSDFNDPNLAVLSFPFDILAIGGSTLLGAIAQNLDALGFSASEWDSATSYSYADFVNYYDGNNVTIYQVNDINGIPAGAPAPPDDSRWTFFSEAFYLRFMPAEDALQPGIQSGDRFYHYAKCYPQYVDTTTLYGFQYELVIAAKSYTTWSGSPLGLQDAEYKDISPNSNVTLGVDGGVTGTFPGLGGGKNITVSFANTTFPRFVVGSKVRIRTNNVSYTQAFSATITALTGNTGFTATIYTVGSVAQPNWVNSVAYGYGDVVYYAVNSTLYYVSNPSGVAGTLPTNTTYFTRLTGTFTNGTVDPIIQNWNLYLDTNFFEQDLLPIPAGATTSSNTNALNEINNYAYNDQIVNQKQTLFNTGDYIIHDGFPFDKDSITGGTINITAGILPTAISEISRPPVTTGFTGSLPQSDNRWIPQSTFSGFAYPADANYTWSSYNGATTRTLTVFNDANHTYLPDVLDGNAAHNPSANTNLLKLATPDSSNPPLTAINSVAFKTNDLMFQSGYNPYKIDGSTANDFSTFMVLYPDYVPSAVINSSLSGDLTNWYGVMSQATQTNVLATDIAAWKAYVPANPRLSVRYKLDGTVLLNLGDKTLTAIKTRNGVNRPLQPIIIGLTINAADTLATLTVVDSEIHRSTVTYAKNWLTATPAVPNTMLYGAVPYSNQLHSSKMYVLEINHYYSSHDDAFFDNEIKTMDKMYAVTSGRVS